MSKKREDVILDAICLCQIFNRYKLPGEDRYQKKKMLLNLL